MSLILSRFMPDADAERLITVLHVVLTGCVFAFLAILLVGS